MERKFTLGLVFILIVVICLGLVSCGDKEKNAQLKGQTEELVDALISSDRAALYDMLKDAVTAEGVDALSVQVGPYFEGITSYELSQTAWQTSIENGVSYYTATFKLTSNRPETLQIELVTEIDSGKVFALRVNMLSTGNETGLALPLKIAGYGITALVIVFCVWMIVDCLRRGVKRTWLWIIVILLGVMFTLTYRAGTVSFNWMVGLCLSPTKYEIGLDAFFVRVTVPVGAIVYFVIRKKLSLENKNVQVSVIKKEEKGIDEPDGAN